MKKFVCSILAATVFALTGCAASGYTVFNEVPTFSPDIMFSAKILGGRASYAYERMEREIESINAAVSLTNTDSDVYKFNGDASLEPIEVGKICYDLFNLSKSYVELTCGAFNPCLLPLEKLWGVDAASLSNVDAQNSFHLPTISEVNGLISHCDINLITSSEGNGKYYLKKSDPSASLDFGAIAKGYAIDECVKILNEYSVSSALLDISGNAYFYGDYISGNKAKNWNVGVISPRPRRGEGARGYVCAFTCGGGVSAVTSGDYNRYYIYDVGGNNVYVPHIIGSDGVPIGLTHTETQVLQGASSDALDEWKNSDEWVISATVIGESSALCDALSTAVSVLGFQKGGELLNKVGYKGLIFTEKRYTIIGDVELYDTDKYNGFKGYEFVPQQTK